MSRRHSPRVDGVVETQNESTTRWHLDDRAAEHGGGGGDGADASVGAAAGAGAEADAGGGCAAPWGRQPAATERARGRGQRVRMTFAWRTLRVSGCGRLTHQGGALARALDGAETLLTRATRRTQSLTARPIGIQNCCMRSERDAIRLAGAGPLTDESSAVMVGWIAVRSERERPVTDTCDGCSRDHQQKEGP